MENLLSKYAVDFIWVPLVAYFWNDQRKHKDTVQQLDKDVAILKETTLNEEKAREIVHEVIKPIATNTDNMVEALKRIELDLAERKGRDEAR